MKRLAAAVIAIVLLATFAVLLVGHEIGPNASAKVRQLEKSNPSNLTVLTFTCHMALYLRRRRTPRFRHWDESHIVYVCFFFIARSSAGGGYICPGSVGCCGAVSRSQCASSDATAVPDQLPLTRSHLTELDLAQLDQSGRSSLI